MKQKKGLLLAVVLLLVVATGSVITLTYSRYTSSATGTSTAGVAAWVVKVNDSDIVASDTFTASDITWTSSDYVDDGVIAPGSTGTFTIVIDATESGVAVDYSVSIDSSDLTSANSNITITGVSATNSDFSYANGIATGSLGLNDSAVTLTVSIAWNDENTTAANTSDTYTGVNVNEISIPVTVTATQKVS